MLRKKKNSNKDIRKKIVDHNGEIERTLKRLKFQINYTELNVSVKERHLLTFTISCVNQTIIHFNQY